MLSYSLKLVIMDLTFEDGVIKTPPLNVNENCGGIGRVLFDTFKKYSQRIATINAQTDEFYTYQDLLEKCTRAAIALQKRGLKKGDLIAISSNRENLQAYIPLLAGQFLGLITFSLDPVLTVGECSELLEQVQPKFIFVTDSAKYMITKSLEATNNKSTIINFGDDFEQEFLAEQENEKNFEPVFINHLRDTCIIHFSSGTTSKPKPICIGHYYCLALYNNPTYMLEGLNSFRGKTTGPVTLGNANWYWVSTTLQTMMNFSIGACILLKDKFDAKDIWYNINKYHITSLFVTPMNCIDISQTPKPVDVDISNLTHIITGGYTLHESYIRTLNKMMPNVNVFQEYGMTECGITTYFNTKNHEHKRLLSEKPSSCGLPVHGLQLKVVSLDTGKKCGPYQPGELYIKAKHIFNGFYNKDASESFDDEGYFRSGDLVCFDTEFRFFIVDRIKAILGWNDWLIYPSHIESVLFDHPLVSDAVVIGIPHKIEGERLMGVVILKKDGPNVTEQDLVEYVDARVEDHKRLRAGVRFMKTFPKTITNKINRIKIKEWVLNNKIIKA